MAHLLRLGLGRLEGLLGHDGKSVLAHGSSPSNRYANK
jgi:hypothetical protein